jgi:hypothetical protein
VSEVNKNTKRGREGGVKKQLFGPHKPTRSGGGGGQPREQRSSSRETTTTDVLLTHSVGLFFLRVQSVKGEKRARVGEVFVFPQRARSLWVKSREREKG